MLKQDTRRIRAVGGALVTAGSIAVMALTALATGGVAPSSTPDAVRPAMPSSSTALPGAINEMMGLRASTLVRLDLGDAAVRAARRTAVDLDGTLVVLDLEPCSVRAKDFRVYVSDAGGNLTEIEPAPERSYRGVVVGDADSTIGATLDEQGLCAQIVLGDEQRFWVEPVAPLLRAATGQPLDEATTAAVAGLHVVYRSEDVLDPGVTCGTPPRNIAAAASLTEERTSRGIGGGIIAEIAFDLDFFYVGLFGEAGAQARVEEIVNNGLNVQYPRDVQITYEITTFILRLERVYFADTIFELLDQFQARWLAEHQNVHRDVAELFTGLNLSGSVVGVATLGSICTDEGFNVVESFGNFNQRADLSAHELGHNWNANHCDCPEHTMNPSITGRMVFHPTFTIPVILAFRDTINCARPDNNQCDSPFAIGDGPTEFDTIQATTDGGFTDCGIIAKDLWYEYTASCTGMATASTCDADFDTRIAVYAQGDCAGTPIACDDDSCGGTASSMTFPVAEGQVYLIRVGGNAAIGTGTLVLECAEQVCPDIDGSGAVDFGDILAILGAWGNTGGPEDVDGSGTVGFGDILVILGAWGPCG